MTPIAAERLVRQRLAGPRLDSPEAVVGWLGAVQAQDAAGAVWAVAQRVSGATAATVEAALDAGALVRTHVLRPTWHLVRPADLRWMLALTAPRVRRQLAQYDRRLEIDGALLARSHGAVVDALTGGRHRTRAEIGAALAEAGVEARAQRLAHVMMHAELDALVCSGARRGAHQTYALVDERVPATPEPSPDEALGRLARIYLRSHGPATAHDLAWWSGQTVTAARRGIEALGADAHARDIGGTTYWTVAEPPDVLPDVPPVHLLPNYDEHVVAYRDHQASLDTDAPDALRGWGNGSTPHQITRGGLVVGGWRRAHHADHTEVRATLYLTFTSDERARFQAAADGYGDHLGRPVVLTVEG